MLRPFRQQLTQQTSLLTAGLLLLLPILPELNRPARAELGVGAIVKAFCLSAFENEMTQSGKTPPAGMANYACGCVAERIDSGSSLEVARSDCKLATARRYPI